MTTDIKLGLLGNRIGHSRAKSLHELMGELHGLSVHYQPMDLAAKGHADIESELLRCREQGLRGVNGTHPYKCDAFKCVETLPEFPAGLTSVNTVLFEAGRLLADNTDYKGFCRAFRAHFGKAQQPGRVMMMGSGGVGLAIAYGLRSLMATELVIHDSNPQAAQDLAVQLGDGSFKVRLAEPANLIDEMRAADGVINATPIGMFQSPGNPFPAQGFARQQWAFDAIYTPEETEFLHQCRARSIDTISGFKLFLYQGVDAFRLFTGIEVDAEATEKELLRRYPLTASAARQSIDPRTESRGA